MFFAVRRSRRERATPARAHTDKGPDAPIELQAEGSIHFLAYRVCIDVESSRARRFAVLAASYGLIFLQALVLFSMVGGGQIESPCTANGECPRGLWCFGLSITPEDRVEQGFAWFLEQVRKLIEYGRLDARSRVGKAKDYTDWHPRASNWRHEAKLGVCLTCRDVDHELWDATCTNATLLADNPEILSECSGCRLNFQEKIRLNIAGLTVNSWLVVTLMSIVVMRYVAAEVDCIDKLSLKLSRREGSAFMRGCVRFQLSFVRYVVLPLVVAICGSFVLIDDTSVISLCLNTVAILILLDVDNCLLDLLVEEKERAAVLASAVKVTAGDASRMRRSKWISCLAVELALLGIPQIVRAWTAPEHWMPVLVSVYVQLVLYGAAEVQLTARSLVDGLRIFGWAHMIWAVFMLLMICNMYMGMEM